MEIGLYTVLTDQTMLPGEAAKLIEDAGFDAIAVGEHSHIPSSRETPYPGGELPDGYTRTLDLFVALTATRAGDDAPADGVVDHPDRAARSDHDGQGGREPGPPVRRPPRSDRRARVEHRGDAKPRRRPRATLRHRARAGPGDPRDLPQRRRHVPRRVRQLRRDLVLAQAGPARRRADHHGRQLDPGPRSARSSTATGGRRSTFRGPVERVAAFTAANPSVPVHVAGVRTDPKEIAAYAEAGAKRAILHWGIRLPR